jgi:uncharacterized cupin superfamily protein
MIQTVSPNLTLVTYHRIYADTQGGSHFDTVTVEQSLASGAPPAAPFYVSGDKPALKCPTRQFLALMSGYVEMETTDGTVRRFMPGDLVLLEDTSGKGHLTRNIADGYSTFLVVPVPAV